MILDPIASKHAAARRLVVVRGPSDPCSSVYVVRRAGLDSLLRLQGLVTSLGAVTYAQAKKQVDREIRQAALDAAPNDADRRAIAEHHAAEDAMRAQLAAAGAEAGPTSIAAIDLEGQVALYRENVEPVLIAAVEGIGLLLPEHEGKLTGVLPAGTDPERVCRCLNDEVEPPLYIAPLRLVPGDTAGPDELSLDEMEPAERNALIAAVMEVVVPAREAAAFPAAGERRPAPDTGRLGEALRGKAPRGAGPRAAGGRSAGGGARSRVPPDRDR